MNAPRICDILSPELVSLRQNCDSVHGKDKSEDALPTRQCWYSKLFVGLQNVIIVLCIALQCCLPVTVILSVHQWLTVCCRLVLNHDRSMKLKGNLVSKCTVLSTCFILQLFSSITVFTSCHCCIKHLY